MNKPYQAILVGCGGMSPTWLSALRDHHHERVQVVALVDIQKKAAEAKAAEFGLRDCAIATSLAAALALTRADLVFNCTIPDAHVETCATALEAGCHVLVEKPLAPTVAEGQVLVEKAAAAGKILAVIQNRRYLPGAIAVKRALAEGVIGKVNALYADFFLAPHFGGFRETMEHPLLHDMAIHTFDQCRFLAGVDARRVACHEFNPQGSWFARGASATALFEMTQDVLFSYRGSWCARGFPTAWAGSWRIVGERGTLLWDGENKIEAERVGPAAWDGSAFFEPVEKVSFAPASLEPRQEGHAGNIGEFLDAINGGGRPQTAAFDNLNSVAMVEAAVASALRREPVALT